MMTDQDMGHSPSEIADGSGNDMAKAGEAHDVSTPAAVVARPWKSVAGMRRSKAWKQVAPMFSPEGQEQIVQQVLDRIYGGYSKDIDKRVAQTEDPPPSDTPMRGPVIVPLQRNDAADFVRNYHLGNLAKLTTERIALHQRLAQVEQEINATHTLMDNSRTPPNGHAA